MKSANPKPKTIDEYLATVSPDKRAALEKLRQNDSCRRTRGGVCINYGLAAFRLNGRLLVAFGGWANHCAFYPASSIILKEFRDDLKHFQTSKGTIRFSSNEPLPGPLVKKLVKARMAENDHRANKNRRES
jgi:uncharacterized protein YdhG (YjbR/CyaY superfamily)